MGKVLKVAVLVLVGVTVLIAVGLHLWLGTWIKTALEEVGPRVTGSSVTVKDVDIGLLTGQVQIEGLQIGNPKGFQAPTALKVGSARVRVPWGSLLSNRVVIEEITVDGPEVTYEGVLSKSNFTTILENARAFSSTGVPQSKAPAAKPAGTDEKRFVIKKLDVTKGRVALWVSSSALGNQNVSLALPDIHLRDIGKESGGATAAEVSAALLASLNKASAQAVASSAAPLEHAAKAAEELVGQGNKAVESVKGLFK